ncbi:phage holin family protein [Ruoffia tabacinasalis]
MVSSPLIHLFVIVSLLDILTELKANSWHSSVKSNNNSSKLSFLLSHVLVISTVMFLYPYLVYFDFKVYGDTTLLFYIARHGVSVIDNFTKMGVNIPPFVKSLISKIMSNKQN